MEPRALLDSLDVGLAAIAPDWTVNEWTAPAARLTGLPAERVLGQNFWVAFPSAKSTHVERLLNDVLADGRPRQYVWPARAPQASGTVFEIRVSRGPRNHLVLLFRQVRDEIPTESRAAQILTAFEAERRLYYQLFTALPAPAVILQVDGQILEANPAAVALLALPDAPGARGRRIQDWVPASQRDALLRALRDAMTRRQRLQLSIDLGGDPHREVAAVIENVDQHAGGGRLLFLAEDVSTAMLLQRKLVHADQLAQLGALVSGVGHELNNPLAAIAAFAEVLAADAPTADMKETADIIHQEAMRAGRVVRTLLDFARQRAHKSEPVDVKEVAERVLTLQRAALKRARIKAVLSVADAVPPVMGATQDLQQVLLNAVVNAIQAIESTGRSGQIVIAARRTEGFVSVTVDDTGPGVPPEILDRVFDPFFTTKGEHGTGLGLSISLGIVKGMGGRMWMVNLDDGGARLTFDLPAEAEPVDEAEPLGARTTARPLSVLVVDDEPSVRRAMTRLAERLGHRVASAATCQEARVRLRDPVNQFDALVVDVHLDEAHTGFELFQELEAEGRGRERCLIFTTGDSISTRTRDALARAERPVLKKPFRLEELREVLDRVVVVS
jgi:PAS domain S-box-containing protein